MTERAAVSPVPLIAGLYFYERGGVRQWPRFTLAEIPRSLEVNRWYRERLLVLAGDRESASLLEAQGLRVHRVFDDAPATVRRDAAHRMKHWMCLWALRSFGEFLWVDWDTVALCEPDAAFWSFCRSGRTPKFIHIPGYWATVNCGVYYACAEWASCMEDALAASGRPVERRAALALGAPGKGAGASRVLVGRARGERLDGSRDRPGDPGHLLRPRR